MSRELKFRYTYRRKSDGHIWQITNITLQSIENQEGQILSMWDNELWELIARDQFTGLLDRNGVEIYEGDIIQSDNLFAVGIPLVVAYEKGCFVGNVVRPKNELIGIRNLTGQPCEVIGNIHESPELVG